HQAIRPPRRGKTISGCDSGSVSCIVTTSRPAFQTGKKLYVAGEYITSGPCRATARPMANMSRHRRRPRADAAPPGAPPTPTTPPRNPRAPRDRMRRRTGDEDGERRGRAPPSDRLDEPPSKPAKPPPIGQATPVDPDPHGRPREKKRFHAETQRAAEGPEDVSRRDAKGRRDAKMGSLGIAQFRNRIE